MKLRAILVLVLLVSTPQLGAGTFDEFVLTDQTPTAPLSNPVPTSYAPRYISGFGLADSFTVFFEDRNAAQQISSVTTSTGPEGFPTAVTATNIADTHFVVKDWPITIGPTSYTYRAWGSVGNNPNHNFYGSNDLVTWTLVNTFTISNAASFTGARGSAFYGFHDVILINGTYYAWTESNGGQTMVARSVNGDDVWEAFNSVGGTQVTDGPLLLPTGVASGWTPTGSFFDLGLDRGMGKVYADPRDSAFYLAVNVDARTSLAPGAFETAFLDPTNWTWHDDTTGPAAAAVLSATAEHDLRECWLVPRSSPSEGWVLMYDADFGTDGGLALGYATTAGAPVINAIPAVSTPGALVLVILLTLAGVVALRR